MKYLLHGLIALLSFAPPIWGAVLAPDQKPDSDSIAGWYLGFGPRSAATSAVARAISAPAVSLTRLLRSHEADARANPDDPLIQARLGDLYLRLNRLDEAAQQYWLTARLDPTHQATLESFAFTLLALENAEGAKAVYQHLDGIGVKSPNIRFNTATALAQQGRFAEAADIWSEYLANDNPNEPRAAYNLGVAKLQTGNAREAVRLFDQLVRNKPDNAYFITALIRAIRTAGGAQELIAPHMKRLEALIGPENARILSDISDLPLFLIR